MHKITAVSLQLSVLSNQGVGKVPRQIPAPLRDTLIGEPGTALSRMASRQDGFRDEVAH